MKFVAYLLIFFGSAFCAQAQFDIQDVTTEKKNCYDQYMKRVQKTADGRDTIVSVKMRDEDRKYAEWECGKVAGVVDCNIELRMDPESNIVFKKVTDFSNVSGGNKPFTGKCESCYRNGRIQRRVSFVNGKEEGIDTTFYSTGCPQVIRSMIQGVEHGKSYYFYDSTAALAWKMNHMMGEMHGEQLYLSEEGDTTKLVTYNNGVLHGLKRTYYRGTPSKKSEITYANGLFNGSFIMYNPDGAIIEDLNYLEGEKDQECNYYYNDGTLLKTEHWDSGVKNGEFKTFFYNQTIQVSENYNKGRKEGWFEEFYPEGKPKTRKLYKKNELLEEYRYDQHGRETYSFPEKTDSGDEDDAMPTTDKKKKKRDRAKDKR